MNNPKYIDYLVNKLKQNDFVSDTEMDAVAIIDAYPNLENFIITVVSQKTLYLYYCSVHRVEEKNSIYTKWILSIIN